MTNPDDDALRDEHFRQLRWSLQALASSASDQLVLFPDAVVKADQLAVDFDHWCAVVRGQHEMELSPPRVELLKAIDEKLSTMSRDGVEFDAELWTDAALHASEHWEQVRALASAALEAFGWSVESPPQNRDALGATHVTEA